MSWPRNTSIDNGNAGLPNLYSDFVYAGKQLYYYRMYIYNFNNTFLWFLAKGQYTLYVYTSGNNFVSGYTPRISGTLEISGNQMYFYICTNSETKLKLCVNLEGKQL